ncbi:hypothetical protein COI_2051 [Mannheimia haemolytica serotype A2 str. OVINE]|nr:hypothetical protein COI_2051 [Mannheimia haemolytica serotype A2 str. OVINE]
MYAKRTSPPPAVIRNLLSSTNQTFTVSSSNHAKPKQSSSKTGSLKKCYRKSAKRENTKLNSN